MLPLTLLSLAVAHEPDTSAAHHCSPNETVGFSCPIGPRLLSLCWSTTDPKVLLYRYGKPGAVELTWPTTPTNYEESFTITNDMLPSPPVGEDGISVRPRMEDTTFGFTIDGNQYTLFELLLDFEPDEQGIRVKTSTGQEVSLTCDAPSAQTLSTLLMEGP
ncbi:MAG: hypothetical protein ACI8RZ_003184 [Myxococcota bacterium]|jgi:hypothetical protein